MPKNLLSDTDYTKGWDNRYGNTAWIGKVSKIECDDKHANVRVLMPDRLDHEGTPLISKPIPVLQVCSNAKKSYAIPRIDADVLLMKLANSTSDYVVLGAFYTTTKPPPVSDPKLDYTEWEGGHIEKFDANDDAAVFLTQDFKGGWNATIKKDVNIKTTDDGNITIESNKDVNVKAPNGQINLEQKTIYLKGDTITLEGALVFKGDITHTGNMETSGVHHDSLGYHTSGRERDLAQRVTMLEKRLARLEQSLGKDNG
jgi:phage baseplate assembly protein V